MKIGVLAVQGAFIEHENKLRALGAECVELRKKEDILQNSLDGLVLPGGESTVQGKLLKELNMFDSIKEMIEKGIPVLATCAGMILLAQQLSGDSTVHFGTLPVTVKRNAYGRQLGSFKTRSQFKGIGNVEMVFIRAPYVEKVNDNEVEVLAEVDGKIAGVSYKNQIALAFHPEIGEEDYIHQLFLNKISYNKTGALLHFSDSN